MYIEMEEQPRISGKQITQPKIIPLSRYLTHLLTVTGYLLQSSLFPPSLAFLLFPSSCFLSSPSPPSVPSSSPAPLSRCFPPNSRQNRIIILIPMVRRHVAARHLQLARSHRVPVLGRVAPVQIVLYVLPVERVDIAVFAQADVVDAVAGVGPV